ncbi:putative photosynthetic complex assembly protein PuhE [Methylobacterium sp. NEAU K]|uniref:putative photosynthetic complex assembly protein PuhE n=1 Tax=Methylobacterium sp. NEAU K TaxID=3064946 RepID=UPI002733FAFC|nr:putative photosynthetic complex assembly protein PuhE [Methylobacterium sp. NEAU K]MDP4003806.1 putative photosynthetic complex assembly protein PuhE [Methylobacterium sp. NEAU K]
MATYAAPVLYAVLVWWFSTGLILLLDHAPRRTHPWSMAGATLLLAAALVAIHVSAGDTTATGAYTAFTAALVVWGWQEMSYYMGFLSGPKPAACAPGLRGLDRFLAALATSLWHEFAIVIGGLAILALVWGSPNTFALWTYGTLVVMNLSARLNLFLGVRNLYAEFLPDHLGYLACYLTKKPMNMLFPVSVSLGTIAAALLGRAASGSDVLAHELIGFTALATLMALATLEHWFLMLPLPSAELWRWSLPARTPDGAARSRDNG